ncbi:glycosyltransferase family 2 protein [Pedobacter sp. KLB.chiD]|uniref:glycosyltransferase family 2 protein n=1 Tax=Pedobacter sp. KLB.chiD TaxID=3387402 RepID=UPI00399C41B1
MTNEPLISIIMPLYNVEMYVSDSIECIINQTYSNWELIIVNDGSTDNSLSLAKKFESPKIKIYSQENQGQCVANNYGFKQSKGDYIKFFDSDDLISLNMLEEQAKLLAKNPTSIISAKWGRFYYNDISTFKLSWEECWKDLKPVEWVLSSWESGKSMLQCGLWLIPRTTLEKVGLWDESLTVINDLEFFTRLILNSSEVKFSDQSIVYYRSGNLGTLSGEYGQKAVESCFKSINLSTGYLLEKDQSDKAKQCVANVWQSFIYMCYPDYPDLLKQANNKLKFLPKPTLKYSNNKRLLFKIFGWKFIKRLKKILDT